MRCPIYSTTQLARVSLKIEIHISLNRSGGSTVAHSAAAAEAVALCRAVVALYKKYQSITSSVYVLASEPCSLRRPQILVQIKYITNSQSAFHQQNRCLE